MHKKHIFLRVFQKITIFACVFCAISAWAETTTCDINYTPVTGNSWQNGAPTPTSPVEIESIGTKVGNKYAVQVAVNYDGGVVDLGTLNWSTYSDTKLKFGFQVPDSKRYTNSQTANIVLEGFAPVNGHGWNTDKSICWREDFSYYFISDSRFNNVTEFKQAMSGKMLYYRRATDETWTAPTLKTVYLDEPLRKVGDYADVLDYKNGTITRNVGVKVLDGTENITAAFSEKTPCFRVFKDFNLPSYGNPIYCTHYQYESVFWANTNKHYKCSFGTGVVGNLPLWLSADGITTVNDFKAYLAEQYANGTPVTIYYPLATPVVEQIENWSCTPPITDIKIATTKMVDEEFATAEANLAATVQTIESVVSRTIAQTGQIATLQETKQTRPDETCPANMKCLLVQDEDGTPHWYPIIEP